VKKKKKLPVTAARFEWQLRQRLKGRVVANDNTSRIHPDATVRARARARASAYRTAMNDADLILTDLETDP
jgi:hypothetical protein